MISILWSFWAEPRDFQDFLNRRNQ
jgi:hypothetical protein